MRSYPISIIIGFMVCFHAAGQELATNGRARMPIVISVDASPQMRGMAVELADGLKRITGGEFEIVERASGSSPGEGIVLGTERDWPGHIMARGPDVPESLSRDDYLLRSSNNMLLILGRGEHGTRNAIWGFFREVGFRQYFPGPVWEVWPKRSTLSVQLNLFEKPDYHTRRISMNIWQENAEIWKTWQERNRMVSGFNLWTGHIYGRIIKKYSDHFKENPEDIAAHPGRNVNNQKLDPSRPSALEVAERFALDELMNSPDRDSISMDPSDGGAWRQDSPLGNASNQAVTLANHVAKSIAASYPGRKVGIYAYNDHSPAPDIAVEPNVIVSIATAFLRGGHTTQNLIRDWHSKGAEIGIREYLSVWTWSRDLPGASRASNLDYLFKSIPEFHRLGARYWISEASSSWGVHGLGYYLAANLLWDVDADREVLLADFFTRAFEETAPEARAFYELIEGRKGRPLLSEDLLARMYEVVHLALAKTSDEAVRARWTDLVRYTYFVELMFLYQNAESTARQDAYEKMARFVYKVRQHQIANGRGVFKDLPARDKTITARGKWTAREDKHVLKEAGEVSIDALLEIVSQGLSRWEKNSFTPVSFSGDMIPLGAVSPDGHQFNPVQFRGVNRLYLHAEAGRRAFTFTVKGGYIYKNRGPVRLALYADQHAIPEEAIATLEVPNDRMPHEVELPTQYEGGHYLEIRDGNASTFLDWPGGQRVAIPAAPDMRSVIRNRFNGVFFVPKGTRVIGGYSSNDKGRIFYPNGSLAFDFAGMEKPGYFEIVVPEGDDNTCWSLRESRGPKYLLTVPPYFGRHESELLVPSDAVATQSP